MTATDQTVLIRPKTRVTYANGLYEVVAINAGLLTLDGVTTLERGGYGRCRERVTVLASDVVVVGEN